jgi:hypothetical protein
MSCAGSLRMEEDELLDLATLTVIIVAMVGFVGLCTYFAG